MGAGVPLDVPHLTRALPARPAKDGFDPDQPRVPAGNPDGGQWTGEDGNPAHTAARDGILFTIDDDADADTERDGDAQDTFGTGVGDLSVRGTAESGREDSDQGNPPRTGTRMVSGLASWYNLPGHRMANGKIFDARAMNAAMLDVPFGTMVTVELEHDPTRSIQVTVTDRGPYAVGRVIDLTRTAFRALVGNTDVGLVRVRVIIPKSSGR